MWKTFTISALVKNHKHKKIPETVGVMSPTQPSFFLEQRIEIFMH
jgi:hypothetical protein